MKFLSPSSPVSFLLIAAAFLATSCRPGKNGASGESVTWPELAAFDELAYQAEGLAKTGDLETVRALRSRIVEAGWAVSPKTLPANAANPEKAEQLLQDLSTIVNGLTGPALDDETLSQFVIGLHPVIASLMETAGMPHIHANEGPNGGFFYPVFDTGGGQIGTAEIKLHDDAGDIEIWLTQGGRGGAPWRFGLDTILTLDFPALGKQATLAVRDREKNADESGASTIESGQTHYFVYPGATGADAAWLTGAEFAAKAELRFVGGTTGSIVLRPHVHHEN
jgi:hypothetical protein